MFKKQGKHEEPLTKDSTKTQLKVLEKMMFAALFCCAFGAIEMFLFRHLLLSAIFAATFLAMLVCGALLRRSMIHFSTAALTPMLILCFVYTPVSWYTFDGLMGNTPYLTIIFVTMILLTNYPRGTWLLLSFYFAVLAGMTLDWLLLYQGTPPMIEVLSTLLAWILTLGLIIVLLGNMKKISREYQRSMFDRSVRDALTGLYNRNALEPILSSFEAQHTELGVDYIAMLFDIDLFKSANDRFGHTVGDAVLKTVASRIQAGIRETDYALRYGGDEFLVLLPVQGGEDASPVVSRIGNSVRSITGFALPISVSYGSAYRSECVDSLALIALADSRMYADKQSRRGSLEEETPAVEADRLPSEAGWQPEE